MTRQGEARQVKFHDKARQETKQDKTKQDNTRHDTR